MYVEGNTEARSCNSCCLGNATSIRYSYYERVSCPACTAHAPCYVVICGLSGFTIFFHIISQTARFSETSFCAQYYVTFLYNVWNISYFKENSVGYYHKCTNVFVQSTRYSLPSYNENWTFFTNFRKMLGYQILSKSIEWESSCSIRTDGRNVSNSRFSQFCERAKNPYIIYFDVTYHVLQVCFLGAFAKLRKKKSLLASSCLSVSRSFRATNRKAASSIPDVVFEIFHLPNFSYRTVGSDWHNLQTKWVPGILLGA
jgi:hypothetical protein